MAESRTSGKSSAQPIPLLALFLAWLIPGAGHVYLGKTVRGLVIFLTIGGLFWAGVAFGGVMTVDGYNERWWFAAQLATGVHGLVGWQRQQHVYSTIAGDLGPLDPPGAGEVSEEQRRVQDRLSEAKIVLAGPVAPVARAYAGTAGLLNLMCIFDAMMLALMGETGERRRSGPTPEPEPEAKA